MGFKDIRDYISDQLIFSKTLVVDRPGMIINKTIRKNGDISSKTRVVFMFESVYSDLYLMTKNKIGVKAADDLWYKINKDTTSRYFLFMKKNKIPKENLPSVVDHFFETLCGAGFNFVAKFSCVFDERVPERTVKNGIDSRILLRVKREREIVDFALFKSEEEYLQEIDLLREAYKRAGIYMDFKSELFAIQKRGKGLLSCGGFIEDLLFQDV